VPDRQQSGHPQAVADPPNHPQHYMAASVPGAVKVPAAARALPKLADRARAEE
jgi:hypothetical protein